MPMDHDLVVIGGGLDQRLGRHTPGERALPADLALGDQQRARAGGRSGEGGTEPGRAAADHDQIMIHGHRSAPCLESGSRSAGCAMA